jgi:hypothetical protein
MRAKMVRFGLSSVVCLLACLTGLSSAFAVDCQDFKAFGTGYGLGKVVSPGVGTMNTAFKFRISDGSVDEYYNFDEISAGSMPDDTFLFSWGYTGIDLPTPVGIPAWPGGPSLYAQITLQLVHFNSLGNGTINATIYDGLGNELIASTDYTYPQPPLIGPPPNQGVPYTLVLNVPLNARRIVLYGVTHEVGLMEICVY